MKPGGDQCLCVRHDPDPCANVVVRISISQYDLSSQYYLRRHPRSGSFPQEYLIYLPPEYGNLRGPHDRAAPEIIFRETVPLQSEILR